MADNLASIANGDFEQVLREMEGVARGEDADTEFADEQMALIANWRARLMAAVAPETTADAVVNDGAWIGSAASKAKEEANG